MILTESLGWKEGLQNNEKMMGKKDPKAIKVLAEYLFTKEHMR